MFRKLKEKAGYVSIETVVVAGLILALGAYIIGELFVKAQEVNDVAITNMNGIMDLASELPSTLG